MIVLVNSCWLERNTREAVQCSIPLLSSLCALVLVSGLVSGRHLQYSVYLQTVSLKCSLMSLKAAKLLHTHRHPAAGWANERAWLGSSLISRRYFPTNTLLEAVLSLELPYLDTPSDRPSWSRSESRISLSWHPTQPRASSGDHLLFLKATDGLLVYLSQVTL